MQKYSGRAAWIFEDNFDIDYIIGIENISISDKEKIMQVLMKSFENDFKNNVKKGDILIGGKNFGYGHPHPQAMTGMRVLGIEVIVAESYAFPFYRGELASGMKLFECPDVRRKTDRWDEVEIDINKNVFVNKTKNIILELTPIPSIPLRIMNSGGIVEYIKQNISPK